MSDAFDTANETALCTTQALVQSPRIESEHGLSLEQRIGDRPSVFNFVGAQVRQKSHSTAATQDDRVGEIIGKVIAASHLKSHLANISFDHLAVPIQTDTWNKPVGNREAANEDFWSSSAESHSDPQVSRVPWVDWNLSSLVEILSVESGWVASPALFLPEWRSFDAIELEDTADPISNLRACSADWLGEMLDKLGEMRELKPGWDSYGALPPDDWALEKAQEALWAFATQEVQPDRVLPSVESGVGISVTRGEKYVFLEILNSEEVVGVAAHNRDNYDVWEFDPNDIAEAVEKICALIS